MAARIRTARMAGEERTMSDRKRTRREFFGTSAGVTAAVASVLADPPHAAAQSAGVKRGDLPDLTIKEVKVYVADVSTFRRLNSTETRLTPASRCADRQRGAG